MPAMLISIGFFITTSSVKFFVFIAYNPGVAKICIALFMDEFKISGTNSTASGKFAS